MPEQSRPFFRVRIERGRPSPSRLIVGLLALWLALATLFTWVNSSVGWRMEGCLIKGTTGIPCPTCGTTRLSLAMLRGDVGAAFMQNPMVWCLFAAIGVWTTIAFAFARRLSVDCSVTGQRLLWTLATVAFLANWAYVIAIDGPWTRAPTVTAEPNAEAGTAHE